MYGSKAPKLRDPEVIPHDAAAVEPVKHVYVEQCITNFRGPVPPAGARRAISESAILVAAGDKAREAARDASSRDARQNHTLEAITRYQSALARDPYSASATLGLALAYDDARRKGCALALLKRLDALATHGGFPEAASAKKQVKDNEPYFADYRIEALSAIP